MTSTVCFDLRLVSLPRALAGEAAALVAIHGTAAEAAAAVFRASGDTALHPGAQPTGGAAHPATAIATGDATLHSRSQPSEAANAAAAIAFGDTARPSRAHSAADAPHPAAPQPETTQVLAAVPAPTDAVVVESAKPACAQTGWVPVPEMHGCALVVFHTAQRQALEPKALIRRSDRTASARAFLHPVGDSVRLRRHRGLIRVDVERTASVSGPELVMLHEAWVLFLRSQRAGRLFTAAQLYQ